MSDAPAAASAKRVFISHSSKDKPAVEKLALALRAAGIDAWLDKWEIAPGDDIVARINEGLEECDAGLIVFSTHSKESRWVNSEVSSLTYARITEGKPLIPIVVDATAFVPPLLRPLARLGITDEAAIIDAIDGRRGLPPLGQSAEKVVHRACFAFERVGATGLHLTVTLDSREVATANRDALPTDLVRARDTFLQGFRHVPTRSPEQGERHVFDSNMRELGRALCELCLPGDSGKALATLVDGCGIGGTVEVAFEADHPELLGLPFEALCLPDGRLLATLPPVTMLRRPRGVAGVVQPRLAGPLKILVAVGAPDEGHTSSSVLDIERELHGILDAIEDRARLGNAEVRILEVGHPDVIREALKRDAYHVLHLSCHGGPGKLELEDEDGGAVSISAKELIEPLAQANRALPLVFLSACHGGVGSEQTASLAEALLRAGVPVVVAMQAAVSDAYATALARAFYANLAHRETPLASHALAQARRELEAERRKALANGKAPLETTLPEYATAAVYVAGEEQPLADYGVDKVELKERPVYRVAGPVPQLGLDELIGRRKELRETLRTLRDERKDGKRYAGAVLTGIGGVGKSAVAGRAMCRLAEQGYLIPAYRGRWDLQGIATAVGVALLEAPGDDEKRRKRGGLLASAQLEDGMRLQFLAATLAEERMVLVLDDFEQNLTKGGDAFLDADVEQYFGLLLRSARTGKLLLTSRYPVPGTGSHLHDLPVGPLSKAESRKLFQRLAGLRERSSTDLREVMQTIGGHPRMLEFLDGLLCEGEARLSHVTDRLRKAREAAGLESDGSLVELEEGIRQTVLLGMRDVFLEELLDVARKEGLEEMLLQVAVSNLPLSPAGVAHMLAGAPADAADVERGIKRLESLSLVFQDDGDAAWVHRWTAEGLAKLVPEEEHREHHRRAGRYRMWRVKNESHDLRDGIEAIRNYLAGRDFDEATREAFGCFDALRGFHQAAGIAALAGEVLESLPIEHKRYAAVADEEAEAHLALGFTDRALERYEALRELHARRFAAEPDRADFQHDLSVSYNKVGGLYRDLGQGEKAREAFLQSLQIRERLANAEPDRADYQRDLSISYDNVGDLYRALGQGEKAREAFLQALAISKRLAEADPDRADYQRDLSVAYDNVGDLYRALGQGEKAREAFLQALAISERLAKAEPDRVDYQYDLSISYNNVGDLYRALGQGEKAREAFLQALQIRERLANAEPGRADYQRGLSVSYNKVGDLYRALGQGEKAREAFLQALQIRERLTNAEPDRADYQRDLSASYQRIGDLYLALGQSEKAREAFLQDHAIAERLAKAEPDRADCQVDLVNSLVTLSFTMGASGIPHLQRALALLRQLDAQGRLAPAEQPKIADLETKLGRLKASASKPVRKRRWWPW